MMLLDSQLSANACGADGAAERGDAPALLELLSELFLSVPCSWSLLLAEICRRESSFSVKMQELFVF